MSDMVERVARAICCPTGCVADHFDDPKVCDYWRCESAARAAIEALRTPTPAMLHMLRTLDRPDARNYGITLWNALIDRALESK